jgi:signal transduction histidine kinase/ligand-binding sensor domain-containing protein
LTPDSVIVKCVVTELPRPRLIVSKDLGWIKRIGRWIRGLGLDPEWRSGARFQNILIDYRWLLVGFFGHSEYHPSSGDINSRCEDYTIEAIRWQLERTIHRSYAFALHALAPHHLNLQRSRDKISIMSADSRPSAPRTIMIIESTQRRGSRRNPFLPQTGRAVLLIAAMLLITACDAEMRSSGGPAAGPAALPLGARQGFVSDAQAAGTDQPNDPVLPHQTRDRDISFEHISIDRGLSQSSVNCILQDEKGFMWFGTQDGLNKYDAYGFTVYRPIPGDPNSLSHNYILSLHQDQEGDLWVGTNGGGLNRFERKTGRFVNYRYVAGDSHSLSADVVFSIYQDREGVLWIGTVGGLDRYERDQDQFKSVNKYSVRAILEDREGTLWVGTDGGGLGKLNRTTGFLSYYRNDPRDPQSLGSNFVRVIYQDRAGTLWVGTDGGGLDRFDLSTELFSHYQHDPRLSYSLANNSVQSIYEDSEGTLWIGTNGGGLNILDRDTGRFTYLQHDLNSPHSLSNDFVGPVLEDRMGTLWVGTYGGGINKIDRSKKRFTHYAAMPGSPGGPSDNLVWAIYEDGAGILWIGSNGGLDRFDRARDEWRHYQHSPDDPVSLSSNQVRAIHEDREGTLWVGTVEGYLDRFDRATERFSHYQIRGGSPYTFGGFPIRSIYEDSGGALWVGSAGVGLQQFDRSTRRFSHLPIPGGNDVRAIYQDRGGTLWIGTSNGLSGLDQQNGESVHHHHDAGAPDSLSSNFVLSIYQDRSGTLWVGTFGGGLNRYDGAQEMFTHFREQDGLPNDVVYGILEDDRGYLWLSTNRGLSRFDPQTETFVNYDVSDGLQSNEFNAGAYFKSHSGEMFFGGINGFNAFFPDQIKENPYLPPIVLTALTQEGQDITAGRVVEDINKITLHWPKNLFEFEFASLNYSQSAKNQYAYLLEGFDNDWIYVGTKRFGRYTNLPGGTYALRVIGSNNDGIWNQEGAAVTVVAVPPFWETWWFRGAIILGLALAATGGYRLRVKSIEARNRELEAQVSERTHALQQRTSELEARTGELERRRQVAEGLREILVILNSDRSLEESLGYIVAQATRLSGAEEAIVFRRGTDTPATIIAGAPGAAGGRNQAETPEIITRWFIQSMRVGQPFPVPDVRRYRAANPAVPPSTLGEHGAVLGIPLSAADEVYGGLVLFYAQERSFSDQDLELAFTFADQAALAIANAQLRDRAEQIAAEAERNRLARDLHDAVTQTLFSAGLIAEVLPTLWERDIEEGHRRLDELRELTRGALAEMRTLLLELRPSTLAEAELGDLLRQLAESFTGRARVPITTDMQGDCHLPAEVKVALYRIAQEALNNIAKHAGASNASVSLRCQDEQVELIISDDGCGFDPDKVPPDSLGLGIIKERAEAIAAESEIRSQDGNGTAIRITWRSVSGGQP